jgi:hypothetical protein
MLAFLLAATALLFAALPAAAQAPQSSINLNAYQCPADYDQVSDCTRLDGVVVSVTQDGQPHGEIVSSATEGVELEVMSGAAIALSIVDGQPAGTVLEDTALSFDAVEGVNAVTLTFVTQEDPAPEPPHSDTNALVVGALLCPADYAGNNYARDCLGEEGIDVTVTRDADGFTVTQATGSDGITGFQGLGKGDYTVELGVPGDFAGFLTVCGTPNDSEPRQVTNPDSNRIGVYLGPTEELTCTFFIVPEDARGEPSPSKPTPAGPVTDLPSTGTGDTSREASGLGALSLILGTSFLLGLLGALYLRQRRA